MKPLIYAHRGASGRYPENTFDAFHAALRHGADGIELDVQLSSDHEVVVIHDVKVNRTTNGTGLVQNHTWKELRQLSAGGWFHPRFQGARIPSLHEVFAFAKPTSLRLILEMKNLLVPQPGLEDKVLELIDLYKLEKRVTISSFNYNSLGEIKRKNRKIQTALLYIGKLKDPWEVAEQYQTEQLHAPAEGIDPAFLDQAHRRKLSVIAWTVNDPSAIKRLASWNIDGLITNYPRRARKLIDAKKEP
ncbi:glycerophosphodiester phosphodiesterase [Brevibacillus sp. B_LB10_24]|uniref:glycerophosphodiester phosphodiesterase n=1 Tax=Brevibacillus sp. B_LB10_24 TaxID=3380645 RepID=UPI0038B88260